MLQESYKFNLAKQKKIQSICSPLEAFYKIRLIQFRRFYFSGGLTCLFNHEEWMETSFQNQYWHSSVFYKKLEQLQTKSSLYYLWPDNPVPSDAIYSALYQHGIWYGFHICKKLMDCIEIYTFASAKRNSQAREIYLLETDVIEKFIQYFKSKMFPQIEKVEKDILIPFQIILPENSQKEEMKKKFFQEISASNYYIRTRNGSVKLTKREKDCLSLLAHGKKKKEIGSSLNLSARTVESYLENAKNKAKCLTISQLLFFFQSCSDDI